MHCPNCNEEYRPGVATCPDCRVALVYGAPPVSAAALDARRINRRNIGLVLIGVGVLVFAGGGDAIARMLGIGDASTDYLVVSIGMTLIIAGLLYYSGTKRPARTAEGVAQQQWDRL